jgi:C1A family cysteine protease
VAIACASLTELRQKQFSDFIVKFKKTYSPDEHTHRFKVFQANVAQAEERTRRANGKTTFGITQFSDLTDKEFRDLYLMKPRVPSYPAAPFFNCSKTATRQSAIDWTTKGACTPVKNQGQCGSCWDFSATESVESAWFLAKGSLPVLSEQQTVDCDTTDQGCNGGWPYDAYQYMISAGGVESESDYPYDAQNGQCQFNQADVVATISSWNYVSQDPSTESAMYSAIQSSPLSVCVDASNWSSYTGGIYPASDCTTSLDHCVQAVGIGQDGSGDTYWIVRNSWDVTWGINGFIWLPIGQNACGIAQVVTVPVI